MNNSDHISESLKTIFWAIILKCGSGKEKIRIRDNHPGSATLPVFLVYTVHFCFLYYQLSRVKGNFLNSYVR
jgi:hypothetical protein